MDSFEGIGQYEILTLEPEWSVFPTQKRKIYLTENVNHGVHNPFIARKPERGFTFTVEDSENALYAMLIFFADKLGRARKFWLPDPFACFEVQAFLFDEDDGYLIRVNKVSNLEGLNGNERLHIRLQDGSVITRRIDSTVQGATYTDFLVSTLTHLDPLEDFNIATIERCSLMYLGRFENDVLEVSMTTDQLASCSIEFKELLHEYTDIVGS